MIIGEYFVSGVMLRGFGQHASQPEQAHPFGVGFEVQSSPSTASFKVLGAALS